MAVTHADLSPGPRPSDIGSKTGAFLMILSILCGLCSFVLCLIAETTRSMATWVQLRIGGEVRYECIYSGSGKIPLFCAVGAFFSLAIAMVMEHAFLLVAINKATPPALLAWNQDDSPPSKALTWRAGFFFVTTWICFAVGEVLLMIGLGVESGHLKKWARPRPTCLVVRQGLFLAAGVFGLTTVFLASGLYFTALGAQQLQRDEEHVRQEVLNTSALFASPPRSPRNQVVLNLREHISQEQQHQPQRADHNLVLVINTSKLQSA
ncbi:hypothetical protein GIB67_023003 [Kingdonia uniflora]|uniref:Transmembrane protein n=1 Tax=Kingdonia uniflora TaxID=39325 RepID=A0A7J7P3A0_9MAGN|nr:hypothetical protein GIB67_023003 [Kingdonia uniflora]